MTTHSPTKATKQPPQHAPMDQFSIIDNRLSVGGRTVTEIAEEIGSTPFYVYDSALIQFLRRTGTPWHISRHGLLERRAKNCRAL